MIKLTGLEENNSIITMTGENSKFELYVDIFDEFPFEKLKEELEQILSTSDFTSSHIQHEKKKDRVLFKPIKNQDYKNQAPMVVIYYQWVTLDHHFEFLKFILDF